MLCKLWQKSDSSINLLCPSSIRGSYFPLCQKQNKCCSALWFLIKSMSPMVSNGLQTLPQINSSGSLWIAIVMMKNWSFLLWECFMWQRDWSHIQISRALHDFSKHRIYYWIWIPHVLWRKRNVILLYKCISLLKRSTTVTEAIKTHWILSIAFKYMVNNFSTIQLGKVQIS